MNYSTLQPFATHHLLFTRSPFVILLLRGMMLVVQVQGCTAAEIFYGMKFSDDENGYTSFRVVYLCGPGGTAYSGGARGSGAARSGRDTGGGDPGAGIAITHHDSHEHVDLHAHAHSDTHSDAHTQPDAISFTHADAYPDAGGAHAPDPA